MRFADKSVLVTGSTKRTGYAIAREFVREGAFVYVNGRSADEVKGAAKALTDIGPGKAHPLPGDISNPDVVRRMFEAIYSTDGNINVLVNNSCNQGLGYAFSYTPIDEWDNVMAVNLRGLFLCCLEASKQMIDEGSGSIINLGSLTASRAIRGRIAYITSKGGIDAFTRSLSIELAPFNITVNTLAPGYIVTERWDNIADEQIEQRKSNIPLGRGVSETEIAQLALFLASSDAAYITGQTINMDGGCLAQLMPKSVEV